MSLPPQILDQTLRTPYGEAAYKVVEALVDAGFDAWWVGGSVRDILGGTIPKDIDIATDATPDQLATLFPKIDLSSAALGSVRVPMKRFSFEVTTFREDDEASDGRHPESIVFGTREADAKRRDFTINALYVHPISKQLFDPFEGEADLKERLIRFIGDPAVRIKHDALRILRAVRFRARIDGQYHPETYRALQELASQVEILSGSRVLSEFEKMLQGPNPDRALEDLWELGILGHVLPELHACKGVPQPADYHKEGDVWDHTLRLAASFRPEDGIDVRVAGVFHDCGKAETFSLEERIRFDHHASVSADLAEKALSRMQMPKKRREKISWLITHHMMMGSFSDMNDERKAHWYHHPWFADLLRLFWLDIAGTDPTDFSLYERIVRDRDTFLDSHPLPAKALLGGDEIMDLLDTGPGEKIGEVAKALLDAQVHGDVRNKDEARTFVRKYGSAS